MRLQSFHSSVSFVSIFWMKNHVWIARRYILNFRSISIPDPGGNYSSVEIMESEYVKSLPSIDSSRSRKFGRLEKREGKREREKTTVHSYHDYVDDGFVTCQRVREQVIACRYRWHDACRDRPRSLGWKFVWNLNRAGKSRTPLKEWRRVVKNGDSILFGFFPLCY